MPWIARTISNITFGSIIRHGGTKYLYLEGSAVIPLNNGYTYRVVDAHFTTGVEVYENKDLFKHIHSPSHSTTVTGMLKLITMMVEEDD